MGQQMPIISMGQQMPIISMGQQMPIISMGQQMPIIQWDSRCPSFNGTADAGSTHLTCILYWLEILPEGIGHLYLMTRYH
jgi:hypothetical protein